MIKKYWAIRLATINKWHNPDGDTWGSFHPSILFRNKLYGRNASERLAADGWENVIEEYELRLVVTSDAE